jgi:7-carboxy-7-deazaguanine synthase
MILISEVFQTIQGEATHAGKPSVFVRLQYCPVGCPWCDTKYTWAKDKVEEPRENVFTRQEVPGGIEWNEQELIESIKQRYTARHLVLTGGEPCAQPIFDLLTAALNAGFTTQIETSGTFAVHVPKATFVTVSPKIDMPGGKTVLRESLHRANEVKHPVGRLVDVEKLDALLGDYKPPVVWLQPLSQSEKATDLCVDVCMARNWRISIQLHKYVGLP